MPSSSFPGTHIKVETGERSNYLSVRDLVPARSFYKSMHLISQINKKKVFEITPMSLSFLTCNHFKITILIPPFLTHLKGFWNSTLWESCPYMETRRIVTQERPVYHTLDGPLRWPIRRTAANLATRTVLFCSVLFCSHTGLPHRDSPTNRHTRTTLFSKKYMQSRLTRTAPI